MFRSILAKISLSDASFQYASACSSLCAPHQPPMTPKSTCSHGPAHRDIRPNGTQWHRWQTERGKACNNWLRQRRLMVVIEGSPQAHSRTAAPFAAIACSTRSECPRCCRSGQPGGPCPQTQSTAMNRKSPCFVCVLSRCERKRLLGDQAGTQPGSAPTAPHLMTSNPHTPSHTHRDRTPGGAPERSRPNHTLTSPPHAPAATQRTAGRHAPASAAS